MNNDNNNTTTTAVAHHPFWEPNQNYEPSDDDDDDDSNDDDNEIKYHQRKKLRATLLPDSVAAKFGIDDNVLNEVDKFLTDTHDVIKIYDNARRFEKKNYPASSDNDEEEDEEEEEWETCEYLEIYWDNRDIKKNKNKDAHNKKETTTVLTKVSGVHKIHWPTWDWEENNETSDDSNRMLPMTVTTSYQVSNIDDEVERIVKDLIENQNYIEVNNFIELHRAHLPCFTWIVSKEEDTPADSLTTPCCSSESTNTSSRIGEYPALYKGEKIPKETLLAFQINLEKIPKRMQCIMGNSGLLQLFFPNGSTTYFEEDSKFRIIPKNDFSKLVVVCAAEETNNSSTNNIIDPRLITGWVERRDYPRRDDCPSDWEEETIVKSEELYITYDKFGGYGHYCQSEGDNESGYMKCDNNCGKKHLYKRENCHMVHQGMLRMDLGDMGTFHFSYCPLSPQKTLTISYSCY